MDVKSYAAKELKHDNGEVCNYAKNTMSLDEFLDWLRRIAAKQLGRPKATTESISQLVDWFSYI